MTDTTASLDPKRIASLRVMPPLGLARVGNCTAEDNFADDYLITTEVVGGLPTRPDGAPAQSLEDYRGPDSAIRGTGNPGPFARTTCWSQGDSNL
jgi:hypothetical protein